VHVLTHGLHYASCVFEGERAYNGKVFKSTEHSERLHHSAEILGFKIPFSAAEIDAAKKAAIAANKLTDCYVRPVAWRGSEMMGVSAQKNAIHLAIATWEWPSYFSPELNRVSVDDFPNARSRRYGADELEGRSLHDLHAVAMRRRMTVADA
jgi:branched-chain amino acid aminotransferase